jgi:hypothetical protein
MGTSIRICCAQRILLMAAAVGILAPPASAATIWTFELLPAGGAVSGPPGSTVGWGYKISNLDEFDWIEVTGIAYGAFAQATPNELFDFPILAPGDTVSVPYDAGAQIGLLELAWDVTAPPGTINDGVFSLSATWWDGDPLADGDEVGPAITLSRPYVATVTSVPELSTLLLVLLGAAASVLARLILFPAH